MSALTTTRRRQRQLKAQKQQLPQARAASYARFSSDHQRDESISDQQRRCREFAEGQGHTILPDLEFADERISGTKRNRQGLNALLAAASQGEFNVLYIFSLSRLARESIITMPLLKQLVHVNHVRFISLTEGIDSERVGWEFIAAFMSLVHEQYLKELSQNVLRGQEGALLEGFSVGDWCFGYGSEAIPGTAVKRRGREPKPRMRYVINADEANWVRQIFEWFVRERRTIRWIVRELNKNNVPKDRRATTPDWDHHLVVGLLQNRKYIGIWPWGESKNVRDPQSGDIRHEPRSDEDCAQWTRSLPKLRVVDDETFALAQEILQQQARCWAQPRSDKGQLRGSSSSAKFGNPSHLVSGLFECAECQRRLAITGYKKKFLFCPGHQKGLCRCKTQLPQQLAEKMILNALGASILQEEAWFQTVWESCQQSWRAYCSTVPIEIQNVEQQLEEVDRRLQRLLDRVESGDDSPDLAQRRAERQEQKIELRQRLKKLQASAAQNPRAPTKAWLREQLAHLGETLHSRTPAATTALRALVGGKIVMERLPRPGRKSFFWRGTVRLDVQTIGAALQLPYSQGDDAQERTDMRESVITLDFVPPDEVSELRKQARQLYEEGLLSVQIAEQLQRSKAWVTKQLKLSFAEEGRELPDGRQRRHTLQQKTSVPGVAELLSGPVKTLWDQQLSMQEIASRLNIDRNDVTHAIQYWFRSRGLPIPDGRQHRRELRLKNQRSS